MRRVRPLSRATRRVKHMTQRKLTDDIEITLGESFQFKRAHNELAQQGRDDLLRFLYDILARPYFPSSSVIPSFTPSSRAFNVNLAAAIGGWALVLDKANEDGYRGKLVTRISRYMKREYNLTLSESQLASVGTWIERHSGSEGYNVRFTQEFDWNDGDYGDRGSCFWGGR